MRILPEMNACITWPFSSLTLKVALGRFSCTSPCISITSSFGIGLSGREPGPLEVRLLQQALVLVRHDVGLHLRHEVHGHDDDNQERSTAEIEWYVPLQDQEFGQQAHQRHVECARQRQSQQDLLKIARCLLAWPYAGNEGPGLFQAVRGLLRVVLQRDRKSTRLNSSHS